MVISAYHEAHNEPDIPLSSFTYQSTTISNSFNDILTDSLPLRRTHLLSTLYSRLQLVRMVEKSMDLISITFATLALILSISSICINLYFYRKQLKQLKASDNLATLSEIKFKLGKIPKAFRFHGITEEDLAKHKINAEDLAYLASNFIAGQIYYDLNKNDNDGPFHDDDYRAQMCKSKSTQQAWPLLKKLLDNTHYRSRVELTIKKYQ